MGRTDEGLLPSAIEALTEKDYKIFAPERVYSSRLLRCRQTAACIFPGAEILVQDGLEETDFGEFEYKNYEELNGHPAYQAWIDSNGMLAFPGGESGLDFRKRCCRAFISCIQDAEAAGAQRIAIIAHGGTIMSIMEAFCEPEQEFYHWQVKNGEGFLTELLDRAGETSLKLREIKQGGNHYGIW